MRLRQAPPVLPHLRLWAALRGTRWGPAGGAVLKVASIVGARPQIIKAAALHRALARVDAEELLVHTGQHYDYGMSEVFFEGLSLPAPNHHLGVGSGSHGEQTGEMLKRLEAVLLKEGPDVVVVHGDTNSTLAGALAAAKLKIPVAHVEAGLRSRRTGMPEEINRVVTDHLSTHLFCPTPGSVDNLAGEGIRQGVVLSGDVMREVLETVRPQAESRRGLLADLGVEAGCYALATVHRAESTDDRRRLEAIFGGLALMAKEVQVVLPLHPRTRKALGDVPVGDVKLIDPVGYAEMVCLTANARAVLTDSGGLQKEAYWLGVPCTTLRDETEWVETLEDGWNVLACSDEQAIVAAALRTPPASAPSDDFGGREASARIVTHLVGSS